MLGNVYVLRNRETQEILGIYKTRNAANNCLKTMKDYFIGMGFLKQAEEVDKTFEIVKFQVW